jgi:hypothetical protein
MVLREFIISCPALVPEFPALVLPILSEDTEKNQDIEHGLRG